MKGCGINLSWHLLARTEEGNETHPGYELGKNLKVNFALEEAMKARKGNRSTALHFL
jgi:hypothetical protein